MAEEKKKSFLLYFDMYPSIRILPREQKGLLLDTVFEYAQAAEGGSLPEEVLARYPDMSQECRMAFRFMAETIRRDTEKWREKHRRYSEAAKVRWEKERGKCDEGDSASRRDAELRKYVHQIHEDRKLDAWESV